MNEKVSITRVNISSPHGCPVKGKCKNEAYWFIGMLSVCDKHLKEFCKLTKIDYKGVVEEAKEKMGCY